MARCDTIYEWDVEIQIFRHLCFFLGFKPQVVSVLPYLYKLVECFCWILFKRRLSLEKKTDLETSQK